MDWRTFGRTLIDTRDIDPVYDMLNEAALDIHLLRRFIVAYSWFYHVGVAAWLAGDVTEHDLVREYAALPRGSERRHFRGDKGIESIVWFLQRYHGWRHYDKVIDWWFPSPETFGFEATLRRIQQTPQYGPWMAFKLYDIAVNVLKYPLPQPLPDDLQMYSEPTKGAALIGDIERPTQDYTVGWVVERVMNTLDIGPLEAETVLCKYKSHVNGHYPMGKDTREIKRALLWRPTYLSEHLLKASIFQ